MKRFGLFCLSALLSIAAFAKYEIEVSSFGNYDMNGKTFFVISGNPDVYSGDLEFIYYRDIIVQCLIRKKAIPVDDQLAADICVLLDYGITDKSYMEVISSPIFGQTGIASVTTTSKTHGSASGTAGTIGVGYASGNYGIGASVSSGHVAGNSTTTTTSNYNYNYGITGYAQSSSKVEEHRRVINLYAYDNQKRTDKPIMLWKTNITSDGSTNDLVNVFPILADASIKYMGKSSGGKVKYSVVDENPDANEMYNMKYIENNVVVNPSNYDKGGNEDIVLRSITLKENEVIVSLIANKISENNIYSIRIKDLTYIIYQDEKYPVDVVWLPYSNNSQTNMKGKWIQMPDGGKEMINLSFQNLNMQKGDTFDLVSYSDKKEKKEYFHFKKLVLL